ncbi:MAG: NapC/NirT family cytochrome c [Candidatus Neomarinimicrobiota bacterium]
MNRFLKYINIVRRLSRHWTGKVGVILILSSTVSFFFFQILQFIGLFANAYAGLIAYLLFPALFILGLILVPIGWWQFRKTTGKTTRELFAESFDPDDLKARITGSRALWIVTILTVASIVFLSSVSINALHFMDSSEFCGTACHDVMGPEWAAYQQSPHARVACVDCHIGEGVGAKFDAKLNGVWQMVSATFDLYNRPIPTPVHNLRPARETCEKCHWPDKFYGRRLKSTIHYGQDEHSNPQYTTLLLKIDAGKGAQPSGIHWHIARENEVRFVSVTDEREEIAWVEVLQPDGSYKRYNNRNLNNSEINSETVRTLDCVDCHNRATHIYEDPDNAIDDRIRSGLIDRRIPYIKREGLKALKNSNFRTKENGLEKIRFIIQSYYNHNYPEFTAANQDLLDQAIATLQDVYKRNIHPRMSITWGSYPDHVGHEHDLGCYRCHNQYLLDDQGNNISANCTLCHSILAQRSDQIFEYLEKSGIAGREAILHKYLQEEFLRTSN